MGKPMPMPEPKPEVLERPASAVLISTTLPDPAETGADPDQYLWGV